MTQALPNSDARMPYLDGIRGIMAFCVILNHSVGIYFPQVLSGEWGNAIGTPLSKFVAMLLSVLVSGSVAVQYFYVLTGFLVCRTVMRHKEVPLLQRITKRYLRLMVVSAGAILLSFLTMVCKLQFHLEAAPYMLDNKIYLEYCNFSPNLLSLLSDMFIMPFLRGSEYVGILWSIRYEFWGYLLCYVVCLIVKHSKWRRILYIVAAALSISQLFVTYYVGFFIGVFVADLIYCDAADTTVLSKYYHAAIHSKAFLCLCTILGIYLIACPASLTGIYSILGSISFFNPAMARAMGHGLLLYALLHCRSLQKVLSNKIFLWFGKCSFCTYAFHWPIMLSLQAWLFLRFRESMPYAGAVLLAFALTLPVIYLVSYLSWYFLERKDPFRFLKPPKAESMHTEAAQS